MLLFCGASLARSAAFIVLAWICFSLAGLTSGMLAARLRQRPGGAVLMGLGLSLAFATP